MTTFKVIWPTAIHVNTVLRKPNVEFEEAMSDEIKRLLFHNYIEKVADKKKNSDDSSDVRGD